MTRRSLDILDPRAKARKPAAPFELGTHVVYTQRAAVARRKRRRDEFGMSDTRRSEWLPWALYDGWPRNAMDSDVDDLLAGFDPGEKINKAVFVWDEEGSGVIVGLVKKQTGESASGRLASSYFGEDFEPGYFIPRGDDVWLYAIRQRLDGLDFILAPVAAVRLP